MNVILNECDGELFEFEFEFSFNAIEWKEMVAYGHKFMSPIVKS